MDLDWVFYWLIAAVVLMPIVLIVKGLKAKPSTENPRSKREP